MSQVLKGYEEEHGGKPKSAQQLVDFSKQRSDLKTLTTKEAQQLLGRRASTVNIKALSSKADPRWKVGCQVLLSKDRMGVIRYVGPVPEQGHGDHVIWYGIELSDGTVGYNDGSIKGKRYFQTDEKRGMFVPPDKIRRVINEKDKQRRNSYAQLAHEVRGKHQGMEVIETNGAIVINYNEHGGSKGSNTNSTRSGSSGHNGEEHDSGNHNSEHNINNNNINNNGHSIYIAPRSSDGDISPLSTDDNLRPWEKEEFSVGGPSHKLNMKAKMKTKSSDKTKEKEKEKEKEKTKGKGKTTKTTKSKTKQQQQANQAHQAHTPYNENSSNHTPLTDDNGHSMNNTNYGASKTQRPRAYSIESDRKDYGLDLDTLDIDDTMLEYIVRQSSENMSLLLDVYAHPDLNPILKDTFAQLKEMEKEKQAMIWPQLMKRWRRYLRTKKL